MNKNQIDEIIQAGLKMFGDNANNISIGGSVALWLHGLELGKEIEDVDLVIYQPTAVQFELLDRLSKLFAPNVKFDFEAYPGQAQIRRSYKLVMPMGTLDILVEHGQIPNQITFYRLLNGELVPLNTVRTVMGARRLYASESPRVKDYQSSLLLKQNNFNLL